jgi:hypothetical protein
MSCRLVPVGLIVLVLAGCGPAKLDLTRKYTLDGKDPAQTIELEPQTKAQTINIEFSSSDGDVSVLVFKKADAPPADDALIADPKKALVSKKGKADSFSVDIPENTGILIIVRMETKKTDVELKVTNKKA